ncbi:unnamed protein product, partial [Rhizoctonia solani]
GIGIRVTLYVQFLLSWSMYFVQPRALPESARMAYMTATALLITSFLNLSTQTLGLLDALVISLISTITLVFASTICSPVASLSHRFVPYRPAAGHFRHLFFTFFWGACCFRLWRHHAHSGLGGSTVDCISNHQITFWPFGQLHATNPNAQKVALALVATGCLALLCSALAE